MAKHEDWAVSWPLWTAVNEALRQNKQNELSTQDRDHIILRYIAAQIGNDE